MKKKIHLFDLPEELYIEVNSKFREEVFNLSIKRYGNCFNFANILKENVKNVQRWKKGSRSASLIIWKKITQLKLTSEKEIEKNVLKLKRSNGYIKNPRLPIIIDNNLARILAATFCDGGIFTDNGVHYTNSNRNQIELINKAITNAFGEVPLIHEGERRKGTIQLVYSGILGIILHKIFKIPKNKKIFVDAPIPEIILNSTDEVVKVFIQQCYDDEGWVNKGIGFGRSLKNDILISKKGPLFLRQLQILLKERYKIKTTGPRICKKREYFFNGKLIRVTDFEIKITNRKSLERYQKFIGFNIDYKSKELAKILRNYKQWQTPNNESLKYFLRVCAKFVLKENQAFSTKDIEKETKRTISRVTWAIKELNRKGFITLIDYTEDNLMRKRVPLYTLTNKGLRAIFYFKEIKNG